MDIHIHKRISDIRVLWERLYDGNREMTWFQSYEWNKALEKQFSARNKTRYLGCSLQYIVINEQFIAPLVIDKRANSVELLGHRESSDYLSFIFCNNLEIETLRLYLIFIFNKYINQAVCIGKVQENSILDRVIMDIYNDKLYKMDVSESECVWVDTHTESESFYQSLSKSSRQNYRTAINRITKEGHSYKVSSYYRALSESECNLLYAIYRERRDICDLDGSFKQKISTSFHNLIKKLLREMEIDILSNYAINHGVFLTTIEIDGQIAAFCEGDINNDGKILSISRVATKKEFYKYSPGHVLLVETIENLKNDVEFFDLTRGTEEYKFRLGGVIHHNHCFTVKGK